MAGSTAHGPGVDPERHDLFRRRHEKSNPEEIEQAAETGRFSSAGRCGNDIPTQRLVSAGRAVKIGISSTGSMKSVQCSVFSVQFRKEIGPESGIK